MLKFFTVSSNILSAVGRFFQKTPVKVATTVALLTTFISIIPFELAFDEGFVDNFRVGGPVYNIFAGIAYFVPVGYLFKCFLLVFLLHYTKFFWALFHMIFGFFRGVE